MYGFVSVFFVLLIFLLHGTLLLQAKQAHCTTALLCSTVARHSMALLCMCELSSAKQHTFFCCCCLSCVQCGLLFLKLQGFEKHCRVFPYTGKLSQVFQNGCSFETRAAYILLYN